MAVMLTTVDNPYSPFDEWDAWYAWDIAAGYHTTAFLGRIVQLSDQFSESYYEEAVENAIDEIVHENVTGMFRKVTQE